MDDEVLDDLRRRLKSHRFTDPLPGVNFTFGFRADVLREVVNYWYNDYDWRAQERLINSMGEHFTTQIEGLKVHFIRVKPDRKNKMLAETLPVLICHGWPGSVFEFYKLAPKLIEGKNGNAFEVIMPSIPGYGFSDAPCKPGFNAIACARIFATVMDRLGHKRYLVQGGDWGSLICRYMAILYPDRVIGYHTNFPVVPRDARFGLRVFFTWLFPKCLLEDPDKEYPLLFPFWRTFFRVFSEMGYMILQSTKPDTVGTALNDSPGGLAAYILEKFSTWTDYANRETPDGRLTVKYTLDELITNVMIYWVTGTITSSQRFYRENVALLTKDEKKLAQLPVKVPTGVAAFPHEIYSIPKSFLRSKYPKLVHYSYMPRGGHFAAFEGKS